MKLLIALHAASVLIRFDVPGPGTYYLYTDNGNNTIKMETSNYVTNACHVTFKVPLSDQHKIMWTKFVPDKL